MACLNRIEDLKPPMAASIESFEDLWKAYCHVEDLPCTHRNDTTETTLEVLYQNRGGLSLRFQYRGIRAKIPCLLPLDDGFYKAVYPINGQTPRDSLLDSMLLNRYIAAKNGVPISRHEVVYLNKKYVRSNPMDLNQLFLTSDMVKKSRGGWYGVSIDEMLDDMEAEQDIEARIGEAIALFEESDTLPAAVRCKACVGRRKCMYFEDCFPEGMLPDNSIQYLAGARNRAQMEEEGLDTLAKADPWRMEGSALQYAQVMADREGGQFLDANALSNWIEKIEYPLTYMDFEWDTYSIPPYPGMMPFDVLCFQYSLHIEETPCAQLIHKNFFESGDCRRSFIESLLAAVPPKGSIMVFNLAGGERLRLMQLARQFPEYEKQINRLCERLVDLAAPFEEGAIYELAQKGHFSLKTLLPLFTDKADYQSLDVKNGLEAVEAYRACIKESDPERKEQIAHAISEYCAMDTYAEAQLFHGLKERLSLE